MNNVYLLHYDKETDNKIRWATIIDGAPFTFYIPKWRVPDPAPSTIKISLFSVPLPPKSKASENSVFKQTGDVNFNPFTFNERSAECH